MLQNAVQTDDLMHTHGSQCTHAVTVALVLTARPVTHVADHAVTVTLVDTA